MLLARYLNPGRLIRSWIDGRRSDGTGRPALDACPTCGGTTVLFEDRRPQRILICSACRHLCWDVKPTARQLTKYYTRIYTGTHDQVNIQADHREYYRGHVAMLAAMLGRDPDDLDLIDYGSSIPWLVREARDLGYQSAVAVDLDHVSAAFAKEHGLTLLTPSQFEATPPDTADIIRFSHVLEHVPDPVGLLRMALTKLRRGGLLYITHPSFPVLQARYTNFEVKDSTYPNHLHFFSPMSMKAMVDRLPLRVIRFYTNTLPDETYELHKGILDLDLARTAMEAWATLGEAPRGEKANYPYYCGENSELFAVKV